MALSVDKKPTLECIMEDIDYDSIYYDKKISLTPYYKNLDMAKLITKLIQTIECTLNEFHIVYRKHRNFIMKDYIEEMMEEVDKYFEKIYKLIHLTYRHPQSAFRVDNKVYEILFSDDYLDDEYDDNIKTMESIYQKLLEIDVTIQTCKLEIETFFMKSK